MGHFCGLDCVRDFVYGDRFLGSSRTFSEWPCMMLMFRKIVYAQQENTKAEVPCENPGW